MKSATFKNIFRRIMITIFSVLWAVIVFLCAETDIYNDGAEEILTAFCLKKCKNVIAEDNHFGEGIDGNIK